MLWLPPAFPCCPLPPPWEALPFHGETNPGKGISSNAEIPDSSVLLDLVCKVLLFSRLETFVYCLVFLLF